MFVFENEITKLKEEIEHNNEMFSEFGIKYEKLEKKLEDKSKRLQKRVNDIEQLTAKIIELGVDLNEVTLMLGQSAEMQGKLWDQLAEANGLLDEVEATFVISSTEKCCLRMIRDILAKRREVE